ncbi:MAG: hypothetical protein NVS2B16_27730 [Chloroflexota bacterium]
MTSLAQTFRRPAYALLGVLAFAASLLFYLWSSQVLTLGTSGVAFLPETSFISAAVVMASLFGLTLPVQVYAIRAAAAATTTTGGTLLGVIVGTASMSCCAPVVLPALLSFLGFSGTTILGLNGLFHRYWLPLATLSSILLAYSLVSTTVSLTSTCELAPSGKGTK